MESPQAREERPSADLKWKARPVGSAKGHAQTPNFPLPMHRPLPPFLATVLLITACGPAPPPAVVEHAATHEVPDDLRRLYEAERVQGWLVVHDAGRDHWYYIDSAVA